jgi:hypothetical protein
MADFAAARRLDPSRRELDPARYMPEVVKAFAGAGAAAAPGTIQVRSPFDGAAVYIDGHPAGLTPASVRVSAGVHYVTATLDDFRVTGARVALAAGATEVAEVRFERLSTDERARGLRRRLVAGGSSLRDTAVAAVAVSGADAVILVVDPQKPGTLGAPVIVLFDPRTDVLGEPERLSATADNKAVDAAIAPLAPLRVTDVVDREPPGAGVTVRRGSGDDRGEPADRPWWKRRWVQASIAGGLAVGVVGVVAATMLRGDGMVSAEPPTFERGNTP